MRETIPPHPEPKDDIPVLVIQPGSGSDSPVWRLGYEHEERFRAFAAGIGAPALEALIEAERRRNPDLKIEDRR